MMNILGKPHPSAALVRRMLMAIGVLILRRMEQGETREHALQSVAWKFQKDIEELQRSLPEGALDWILVATCRYGPAIALAWAENAFATIEVAELLGASLMCTSVPPDVARDVPLPWRCFCLVVPQQLLAGSDARLYPAYLFVIQARDGRLKVLEVGDMSCTFNDELSLGDFAKVELGEPFINAGMIDHDAYRRVALLVGRLLVGVCIEMDTPKGRTAVRGTPEKVRLKRGEPKAWNFQLGRPVKLDVREALREYATGVRRGSMSVQTLVCGHRKRQPHGPANADRKWIHIEPYWKGPEDAPIIVRPHAMGEEKLKKISA